MPTSAKPGDTGAAKAAKLSGTSPRVLAADDQQHILEAIELLLRPQGYLVDTVRSPALARQPSKLRGFGQRFFRVRS